MLEQTLSDWVRLADKGAPQGAGERAVPAEQMELARQFGISCGAGLERCAQG